VATEPSWTSSEAKWHGVESFALGKVPSLAVDGASHHSNLVRNRTAGRFRLAEPTCRPIKAIKVIVTRTLRNHKFGGHITPISRLGFYDTQSSQIIVVFMSFNNQHI